MLYLSRVLNNGSHETVRYGVVDTDDDVETLIDWSELKTAVLDHGIKIKGIEVSQGISGVYVKDTTPFQDRRYLRPAQVKAKTLLGVDITVWKNMVTCIVADGRFARRDVSIRLSDYGTELAGNAYIGWLNTKDRSSVLTIILDDKITDFDCSPHHVVGVKWDISEVTKDKIINTLRSKLTYLSNPDKWSEFVIDRRHRFGG